MLQSELQNSILNKGTETASLTLWRSNQEAEGDGLLNR